MSELKHLTAIQLLQEVMQEHNRESDCQINPCFFCECAKLEISRLTAAEAELAALRAGTPYQAGGQDMARSCLAAVKAWPKDEVLRWLQAVIDNDAGYLEEVKRKMREEVLK